MNKNIKNMNYVEFKTWCNERACDGKWGTIQAMTYISIMEYVNSIKIKGLFKRKATRIAQELKWKEIVSEL